MGKAIAGCVDTAAHGGGTASGRVHLSRGGGRRPLSVLVIPLRPQAHAPRAHLRQDGNAPAGRVDAADPAERRRHRSIATAERLFTAARPRFRAGTRRIYRAPRPLRLAATASTSLRSAALNRMPHRSCIPRTHTRARRESPSASKISDLVRADSDQIDPSLRANGSGPKWPSRGRAPRSNPGAGAGSNGLLRRPSGLSRNDGTDSVRSEPAPD